MNAIVRRIRTGWLKEVEGCRKKPKNGSNLFFFVFLIVIVREIVPILRLFLFFIVIVIVIGYGIDLDGMNLYDFHFGFALGAGQNLAFLDFIFVHVNFGGAFRTTDHGENLLGG
jgi:hypothetical protein